MRPRAARALILSSSCAVVCGPVHLVSRLRGALQAWGCSRTFHGCSWAARTGLCSASLAMEWRISALFQRACILRTAAHRPPARSFWIHPNWHVNWIPSQHAVPCAGCIFSGTLHHFDRLSFSNFKTHGKADSISALEPRSFQFHCFPVQATLQPIGMPTLPRACVLPV